LLIFHVETQRLKPKSMNGTNTIERPLLVHSQIQLKTELSCRTLGQPFPAGLPLRYSIIQDQVVVHHPDDPKITKVIQSMDVDTSQMVNRYLEDNGKFYLITRHGFARVLSFGRSALNELIRPMLGRI